MYQGDTVRLQVNFKSFKGKSVDPTDLALTVYDSQQNKIEQVQLDDTNRIELGVFTFDYVLPDDKQEVIFEFRGLHNQKPILVRDKVEIKFL